VILSRRDLDFLLYEWLDVPSLTRRDRYAGHSRETFDAAIDLSTQLAVEKFYPINQLLDRQEPTFDGDRVQTPPELQDALRVFCDAGLLGAAQDEGRGGMQLPYVVSNACMAWFHGACSAATGYTVLSVANANLLLAHGTAEQIATWVEPLLQGRFFGTMCLSETQAGSSLSDIRTVARRQPDGSYRLFGSKMWISGGDHELSENIVHLVLAKIADDAGLLPPGVKGISLFLAPKFLLDRDGRAAERNDIATGGLNHKMGVRGTSNCLLNFGEGRFTPAAGGGKPAPGAVGWLVGEAGKGLQCMFHMMNEARISVGLGAVMLGYTGYLHSLDYARNRPQGRHPRGKDPAQPQIPIIQHADVRRMLLAQKSYVEGGLALTLYCARLVDDTATAPTENERADARELLELLTPVAKSWPAQWCLEANSLAIQIHGGYGYTHDYAVEQHYRDNRLNAIHEGTHGIQALDLLGRKVRLNHGHALQLFAALVVQTARRATEFDQELASWGEMLCAKVSAVRELINLLYDVDDADVTLANASTFLEAFGHIVVSWIWLELALVAQRAHEADTSEAPYYQGKRQACRYFFRIELPKVAAMLDLLRALDRTCLDMRAAWF
jgi:alkylation response protein AidB-like acyl-CoA dehydrogenase